MQTPSKRIGSLNNLEECITTEGWKKNKVATTGTIVFSLKISCEDRNISKIEQAQIGPLTASKIIGRSIPESQYNNAIYFTCTWPI